MEQPPRNLNAYRVADLRELATTLGLPTGGTKTDLIARIQNYYRTGAPAPTLTPQATAPQATATPTATHPERRRQNPFETINDIAGTLGDVLTGRVRFENVKEQLRRELGTYSVVDFKNVYEVMGLTRPRQATKANYIDKLMTYLETYTPPKGVPAPAPAPAPTPKAPALTPTPKAPIPAPQPTPITPLTTIDPALRNYFEQFVTDPTFILMIGEDQVLRRRLDQLSLEQLRALAVDRFGYTTSPYDTKESIINSVINTLNAKAQRSPIALRRRLEQLSIEQVRALSKDRFGYAPNPYDTKEVNINAIINRVNEQAFGIEPIDPFLSEYIDEFIQDPAKLATTGGQDAFRGTVMHLTEQQLRYIAQSRFEYTVAPGVTKDNIISFMIDEIRARAPGGPPIRTQVAPVTRETQDIIDAMIRNPQRITQTLDRDVFEERLNTLTTEQLRDLLRARFGLTPPITAVKQALIETFIRQIELRTLGIPHRSSPYSNFTCYARVY